MGYPSSTKDRENRKFREKSGSQVVVATEIVQDSTDPPFRVIQEHYDDDAVEFDNTSIAGNTSQNIDFNVTQNIKVKRFELSASTQAKFEVLVNKGAGFFSIATRFIRQQDPNQLIEYYQSLQAGDVIRIVKENNYVDAQSMYSYIYYNIA